jgi:hypothetical protein
MKKISLLLVLLMALHFYKANAQSLSQEMINKEVKKMKPKYGLKLGYNIARLSGSTPDFSPQSRNGFNVSAFYAPASKGLGYRTELVFSRQGFAFDDNGKMQNIRQDYIYMPHLTTFTIAQVVQLQAGGQIGYLLSAANESSTKTTQEDQMMQFMNRFDYGAALGLEIYPFKGLIVGGRYNISLGNPYKNQSGSSSGSTTPMPFPLPVNPADFKGKNAVIQFFAGYRF